MGSYNFIRDRLYTITACVKLLKNIFHQLNKNRIHHCKIENLITLGGDAATLEWIADLPSMSGAQEDFLHKSKQYATQHTAIQKVRKLSINIILSFLLLQC